jgi:3-hydroxybutyryl-CoA dehydrogenase
MLNADTIIGVCGAGVMGTGIAQVAAQAGHRVIVLDLDAGALEKGRDSMARSLRGLVLRGKLKADQSTAIQQRVSWTTDISAIAPAGLTIEAVTEQQEIKQELFRKLEQVTSAGAVLATNTSSLSVTSLARGLLRPSRFLGLHFFNPAPVMKLVEVVSGEKTNPAIASESFALMERWGKVAAHVRDVPGFIVNRVARPFYGEGWLALEEGVADAATIDFLYRDLAGFRMGPFELGDVIGHDVNYGAAKRIFDAYGGKTRFVPSVLQSQLVARNTLGRKTGRGVYDYAPGAAKPEPRFAERGSSARTVGRSLLEKDQSGVVLMWSDGRSARKVAESGRRPVAVFDYATENASSLAFAASSADARHAALAQAARLGRSGVEIADRPGLLVFRTLLQLVNAAADAVADNVADPEAIDLALVNGVNYPLGIFEWAGRQTWPRVARALTAVAEETGLAMYRPADYICDRAGQGTV